MSLSTRPGRGENEGREKPLGGVDGRWVAPWPQPHQLFQRPQKAQGRVEPPGLCLDSGAPVTHCPNTGSLACPLSGEFPLPLPTPAWKQGTPSICGVSDHINRLPLWAVSFQVSPFTPPSLFHTPFPKGSSLSQVALVVKNLPVIAGDLGSIPGLGRSREEGNGNLLQYSCLGISHGQGRLVGHSLWGFKVMSMDMTKQLST